MLPLIIIFLFFAYFPKRCFSNLYPDSFCNLSKASVRPHLEFCSPVWNLSSAMVSNSIESVQRFVTLSAKSFRRLPYPDRLRDLDFVTLKFPMLREDLISYKILMGKLAWKRHAA